MYIDYKQCIFIVYTDLHQECLNFRTEKKTILVPNKPMFATFNDSNFLFD